MIDDMDAYVYYLKGDNDIYGYTLNKDYAKMFESQRNMKLFNKVVVNLNKYELMVFMNKLRQKQICVDHLTDETGTYPIAATIEESDKLNESCEYIEITGKEISKSLLQYPLKSKYLKVITEITQNIIRRDEKNPTLQFLNVNTIKLFYHLFRNTFSEDSERIDEEKLY